MFCVRIYIYVNAVLWWYVPRGELYLNIQWDRRGIIIIIWFSGFFCVPVWLLWGLLCIWRQWFAALVVFRSTRCRWSAVNNLPFSLRVYFSSRPYNCHRIIIRKCTERTSRYTMCGGRYASETGGKMPNYRKLFEIKAFRPYAVGP